MKLTIFGGTGPTGKLVIDEAINHGHIVTAYARNPDKLEPRPGLGIIQGELTDAATIGRAVEGSEAVISLLGPSTRKQDGPPIVTGTQLILMAMTEHGVSRLLAVSTPSMRVPADTTDRRITAMVTLVKLIQRTGYDAIVATADAILGSELDWTLVRVPLLTNAPATGVVNARHIGEPGGLRVSRGNVATFILRELDQPKWIQDAPLISDD